MSLPRILFMGTPEFAVASLGACLEVGEVVAVVTQPDKPKVRRELSALSPVKLRDPAFWETVRKLSVEVGVVAAYGKILPRELLETPARGCVNVHASLLPRFRGAAPIQWAIASADEKTGVCLMKMDEGLDTGPILACAEIRIDPEDTSESLHRTLAKLGAGLIREQLPAYLEGKLQ